MVFRQAAMITALALALTSAVVWTPATSTPAQAEPAPRPDVQAQIDAHLKAHPGGVQTGPYEISYGNGRFVMTFIRSEPAIAGAPDCPWGWYCFYDSVNYGYPRGKLSDCGWQDLGDWGWEDRTESVHYNMGSGSVAFLNHAAGQVSHSFDIAVFGAGTLVTSIADTFPYRNTADHVQRYC